jgi:hypothetical protein
MLAAGCRSPAAAVPCGLPPAVLGRCRAGGRAPYWVAWGPLAGVVGCQWMRRSAGRSSAGESGLGSLVCSAVSLVVVLMAASGVMVMTDWGLSW